MSRENVFHGKHDVTVFDLQRLAELAWSELEQGLMHIRRVSESANGIGDRSRLRFAQIKVEFLRKIVERLAI